MAGVDNLIPTTRLSEEERREMARKAGRASGEARRRKRDFKKLALDVLALTPRLPESSRESLAALGYEGDKPDISTIAFISMAQQAIKGDLYAIKMLLEYAGTYDGRLTIERAKLDLEREKLKAAGTGDSQEDAIARARALLEGVDSVIR